MADQLTDWFPPDVTPVRVGVYEVTPNSMHRGQRTFAYWNGVAFGERQWTDHFITRAKAIAYADDNRTSFWHPHEGKISWRGLAVKP
jgi:hypothetical protein